MCFEVGFGGPENFQSSGLVVFKIPRDHKPKIITNFLNQVYILIISDDTTTSSELKEGETFRRLGLVGAYWSWTQIPTPFPPFFEPFGTYFLPPSHPDLHHSPLTCHGSPPSPFPPPHSPSSSPNPFPTPHFPPLHPSHHGYRNCHHRPWTSPGGAEAHPAHALHAEPGKPPQPFGAGWLWE